MKSFCRSATSPDSQFHEFSYFHFGEIHGAAGWFSHLVEFEKLPGPEALRKYDYGHAVLFGSFNPKDD